MCNGTEVVMVRKMKKLNLPDVNVKEPMGFLPLSVWNLNASKEDKVLKLKFDIVLYLYTVVLLPL